MKNFLRKQYIGLVVGTIIFVVASIGFVTLFLLMKQRLSRVQEVKQTLATYEQNKKTFAKENETLQALTSRIATLEEKRVTEEEVPALLSGIESLAAKEGIVVEVTTVQTPTTDGKKYLIVDIAAQGEFSKLTAFTKILLAQEYQVRFTKLAIHQEQDSAGVWQLLGTFEVMSF